MCAVTGKCYEDDFGLKYTVSSIVDGIPTSVAMGTAVSQKRFNGEGLNVVVVNARLLVDGQCKADFGKGITSSDPSCW